MKKIKIRKYTYLAILCSVLWGLAFPVIKLVYSSFKITGGDTGTEILIAGIRFFSAGLMLFAYTPDKKEKLSSIKDSFGDIFILGLVMTFLQYLTYNVSIANIPGGRASLVNSSNAFLSVILAHFFCKGDRLTFLKIAGCMAGFLGLVILFYDENIFSVSSWDIIMLISALSFSVGSILSRTLSKNGDSLSVAAFQMITGGALLLIVGIALGAKLENGGLIGWTSLAFLCIQSAVTYPLWNEVLKNAKVSSAGVYTCLIPVIGVLFCSFFPDEPEISPEIIITLILVSLGVYLVNKPSGK